MTCADCGLELTEDYGSETLAHAMECIEATGLCYGCWFERQDKQRIRELKGEVECQTNED